MLLAGYWSVSGRARVWLLVLGGWLLLAAYSPIVAIVVLGLTATVHAGVGWMRGDGTRGRLVAALLLVVIGATLLVARGVLLAVAAEGWRVPPVWSAGPLMPRLAAIGIAMVCFQAAAYVIEVYRGGHGERSIADVALRTSFFPILPAGPLVGGRKLDAESIGRATLTGEDVLAGLLRVARGLLKKMVLADTLAVFVDSVMASPGDFSGLTCWFAAYAFLLQFYFDFSGCVDIATGLARLFGVELPANFDVPLLSKSPREFFERWNVSLTGWLRENVGVARWSGAAAILIGALWYGQSANVLLCGAYIGVLLWIWPKCRLAERTTGISWLVTFNLIALGGVILRCPSLSSLVEFAGSMFTLADGPVAGKRYFALCAVCLAFLAAARRLPSGRIAFLRRPVATGVLIGLAVWALILLSPGVRDFLIGTTFAGA